MTEPPTAKRASTSIVRFQELCSCPRPMRGLRNCIGPDWRSQRSVRQWPKKISESAQPSPAVVIRDRGQSYINPLLAERKPQYSKRGNRVAVSPRRRSRDGGTMLKPKIGGIEFFRTAKLRLDNKRHGKEDYSNFSPPGTFEGLPII